MVLYYKNDIEEETDEQVHEMKTKNFKIDILNLKTAKEYRDLSNYELGKRVNDTIMNNNVTQKEIADEMGESSQEVNRWYLTYMREKDLDREVREKLEKESDRTRLLVQRIDGHYAKQKQMFFLKHKKGLDTRQQEKFVSVLMKTTTFDDWVEIEKARHQKLLMKLKLMKKEYNKGWK